MRPVLAALFVPGSRPDRFDKAVASGADAIIIDLEDAVPTTKKAYAREATEGWLRTTSYDLRRIMIRINPVSSNEFIDDLKLLTSLRHSQVLPRTILLPKAEACYDLDQLSPVLSKDTACIALIESAAGLMRVQEIAAHSLVSQLAFGSADYSADVGCSLENASLLYARSLISVASAAARLLPPLDSPCFTIEDSVALEKHAQHGRELGFSGSLCIHPAQVEHIRHGYLPNKTDVKWAKDILAHAAESGASRVGDTMVDAPVLQRAHRIIDASESE